MALRINPSTRKRERQQDDGTWAEADGPLDFASARVKVASAQLAGDKTVDGLDTALAGLALDLKDAQADSLDDDAALVAALQEHSNGGQGKETDAALLERETVGSADAQLVDVGSPDLHPEVEESADDGSDLMVSEIPGLVSEDSGKGVTGARKIRERLQARRGSRDLHGKPKPGRKTAQITVPRSAAVISGPGVDDTTAKRQTLKQKINGHRNKNEGLAQARYTNKGAPNLLRNRPKWVQDLFEAHFRSDSTLAMRRQPTGTGVDGKVKNRMKLSREDFAIGWLTAFDKFREDSRLLRVSVAGE